MKCVSVCNNLLHTTYGKFQPRKIKYTKKYQQNPSAIVQLYRSGLIPKHFMNLEVFEYKPYF